ncbi:hypothetical protein Mgra_00006247 [Meloidogyne graminicola]|uniref:Uncharacterized protein n=1 Tax=Meloidogyne graminicola TaxID=189291 RepID=A0A8S9ZM99_9BILA|nr:hypothetical protein Mgra_00006247 [Meloidogyne graminicola]
MFDGDPEMDDLIEPVISFVPEVTPGAGDFDKLDPAQLLHTALGKDLDLIQTLDSVEEAEQIKDEKLRMIAAVAPSEKAREIAKIALQLRQQTPPKPALVEIIDDAPSTSQGFLKLHKILWKIMIAFLDWISAFLNRRSREHRYVAYVLNKEKEHLKEMMSNVLILLN